MKKHHLESFPAIHMKRMDWMDFVLKFSSELMVLLLGLTVAGFNFFFFIASPSHNYTDNSLAVKFLSKHAGWNQQLVDKNNIIVTDVSGGLFPLAQAEDFTGLDTQGLSSGDGSTDSNSLIMGDENTILAPNPDSVKSLLSAQIKIYQTQTGDTLASIAKQFGISVNTIIWNNKLTASTVIKPGWQLIILPTDGILHKMTSNDTLPDLAKKYSGNVDTIVSYNALADAESFDEGQLIIIPGGIMPTPPAPVVPKVKNNKPSKIIDRSKVGGASTVQDVSPDMNYDEVGHTFPKGYCTWYVAQKLGGRVKWGGNAKEWIKNAAGFGAVVDHEPAPGTIMVTRESRYGHVALVESVTDHNTVIVSEMNYVHFGRVDTREVPLDSSVIMGFIHP